MNLNQLRGFTAIARLGSFTRAADSLSLTQPALSVQIRALEGSLGQPLFERHGRRVLLTPAGRLLARRARRVLAMVDQAAAEIAALKGLAGGRLVIATNDSNCLYLLPETVRLFRTRFPAVELHLRNSHSTQVVAWVVGGQAELGLVTMPVPDPRIETRPLLRREDVLVCARDHPLSGRDAVTPQDLVEHPLLLLNKVSVSRGLLDRTLAEADARPREVMEVGSIEVIKRYVEIGLGVSVIPRFAAERELREGRLRAVALPWLPQCSIGVARRRGGYLSPAARAFLALLDERLAGRSLARGSRSPRA